MPLLFPNLPQVITPTCGIVTALTGPSGSTAGSISIESRAYEIPPGTSIDPQIAICTNTCVTLDPFNQVLSVTYNAPSNISGAVTAYNPGTTIAINGTIYPLATGASVDPGVQTGAQVTVAINSAGAASCIRLNSSGEGGIKSRINLPYVTRNR
ncbi:MAG: hypothetical protein EXR62_11220 [Chloroflexi bacterium]|nr:hypothetical protein [Chloroflexota bacterium]